MGILRLSLAIFVLLQHSGAPVIQPMDANEAVQCFFVISGFYIQLIISEKFARQGTAWKWNFYKSRAARIFPAYYVMSALYIMFPSGTLINDWHNNTASLFIVNISIVAAGAINVLDSLLAAVGGGRIAGAEFIVPTAWSLSPELIFYTAAPFILLRATWLVGMIGALFAIVPIFLGKLKLSNLVWPFLFPEGTSHMVQCFPFEMSLFIAGALAFRAYAIIGQEWPWPPQKTGEFAFHTSMRAPMKSTIIYAMSGVICAASLWYICDGGWGLTPHRIGKIRLPDAYWLVIVTLIVTIPWIFHFSRKFSWDRRLGELSYPVYLGHLLVIKVVGKYYVLTSDVVYWKVVPITLLLAGVIWGLVERPMNAWRHRRFENRRDPSTARVDGGVPALV